MQKIIDAIVPIFVFIAVISGIINSIREAAAKNARPAPQPAQQSRAKAEIEAFLNGGKPPNSRPQTSEENFQDSSRPKPGARPKSLKKQKPVSTSEGKQSEKAKKHSNMGSGLSEHVDSFIGDHVRSHMGRDVDAFVNMDIAERVKSHLGSQSSSPQDIVSTVTGSQAATDLLALLKTKSGVKNAILVNEILSTPRSLRR